MFKRFFSAGILNSGAQIRALNLQEYNSKKLLAEYGCRVEHGIMCQTLDEVKVALGKIKTPKKVVKSQILAGGRGKGTFVDGFQGGVHVCENAEKAMEVAKRMLNNKLVTRQTNGKAVEVRKLYVTEAIPNIKREMYVALTLDRKRCAPTFIGCAEGGIGIEEISKKYPEKIKKYAVNIHDGVDEAECIKFSKSLGLEDTAAEEAAKQLVGIYNLAKAKDCTMVEVNPMVELDDARVMCIDAKLAFDDNAQFRRPEIWAMQELNEKDSKEIKAAEVNINYVPLDGNVGVIVNGAGLAMSIMDHTTLYGQRPADFLDMGGNAGEDQIKVAFEIILEDKNVNVILINIFGGIVHCDLIAAGIVQASKAFGDNFKVPLVVRLAGTNEREGKRILKESGLNVQVCETLEDVVRIACEIAKNKK